MLSRLKPHTVELRQRLLAHSTDPAIAKWNGHPTSTSSRVPATALCTPASLRISSAGFGSIARKLTASFTKEYGVKRLVWYEIQTDIRSAITREKQIKKWKRVWKIELIQKQNPYWRDLYGDIVC